jgi:hypothetical protein
MKQQPPVLVVAVGIADQCVQNHVSSQFREDAVSIVWVECPQAAYGRADVFQGMVSLSKGLAHVVAKYLAGQDLVAVHQRLACVHVDEATGNAASPLLILGQINRGGSDSDGFGQFRGGFLCPVFTRVRAGLLEQPALITDEYPELWLAAELLRVLASIGRDADDRVVHAQSRGVSISGFTSECTSFGRFGSNSVNGCTSAIVARQRCVSS